MFADSRQNREDGKSWKYIPEVLTVAAYLCRVIVRRKRRAFFTAEQVKQIVGCKRRGLTQPWGNYQHVQDAALGRILG